VPRFADLVFPFVLGALEFLLVEWTAPERIGAFFVGLAVIFVVAASMTFSIFRAMIGAGDVPDRPLSQQVAGYYPAAGAAAVLVLCSLAAGAAGPTSRLAVACLLAANGVLLAQIWMFRRYWQADIAV
jgi:hypothetical protein